MSCTSVLFRRFVDRLWQAPYQGAGLGAEAKEGVALGGAHLKMRDDDGPGPLTPASVSRAAIWRRIFDTGH